MDDRAFDLIEEAAKTVGSVKKELDESGVIGAQDKAFGEELQKELREIRGSLEEVQGKLDTPSLRLAFVGTTSSGKSTLLNAIAGQEVAPTDAGEMSAGVVRIRNSKNIEMEVHPTTNMAWKSGKYPVKSVKEISIHLKDPENPEKGIMAEYRSAVSENHLVEAPQIEISVPLAPKNGGTLNFKMPKNIELELVDLPGIKSVTDAANLKTIQSHLAGAFLLVILDYSFTNPENIEKLLDEIKETVDSVCKNKEALIFILNRVDLQNKADYKLEDRIDNVANKIKEKLDLPETPKVIPMSALALFYLQAAWGTEEDPVFEKGEVQKAKTHLENFFVDCAKMVAQMRADEDGKYPEFNDWFKKHDIYDLPDWNHREDIGQLLEWVYEKSHGKTFWKAMREKLNEKAGAVIINPALGKTVNILEEYSKKLTSFVEMHKNKTEKEVQELKERVDTLTADTEAKIKSFKNKFHSDFKQTLDVFKKEKKTPEEIMNTPYGDELFNLYRAMGDISDDVSNNIIAPVCDCIRNTGGNSLPNLENGFIKGKIIPDQMAIDIRRAINNLVLTGYTPGDAEIGRTVKVELKNFDATRKEREALEDLRVPMNSLYLYVGEKAIFNRCYVLLLKKIGAFTDKVNKIISKSMNELSDELKAALGDNHELAAMLVPQAITNDNDLTLDIAPEPFNIKMPESEPKTEEQGIWDILESLFKEKKLILQKNYRIFYLESAQAIENRLETAMKEAEAHLWDALFKEITKVSDTAIQSFAMSLEKGKTQIHEELDRHFKVSKEELEARIKAAETAAGKVNSAAASYGALQKRVLGK